MKLGPPRLLPIVIAAAAALLIFKGVGLVTGGGYILTGTEPAFAAGGETSATGATTELPIGTNIADTNPTLEDNAVTMKLPEGAPAAGTVTPQVGPADMAAGADCPAAEPAEAQSGEAAPEAAAPDSETPCIPDPGVNEHGDALPLIKDNTSGNLVPLSDLTKDASSEGALNSRLGERRDALDQREEELEMRSALVEAAEKRLEERTAELKALEEKVGKLVEQNKATEEQQFVGLVAMYETMKPKDAATIFNQLDLPVLLGVAKAMNPRKMAPILAKMDPMKAKALTDGIAAADDPPPATTAAAAEDLTNLPQIVGQ